MYTYDIIAVDSLGQTLDTSSITDTCDSVAFIPDIDEEETPEYFKQDSLEVFWKWIDDINGKDIAQRTEGADSLAIQISISDNFPSIADQTITTDYFEADVNRSKKIQIPKLTSRRNEKIFIRITAKDKWEHNSISSKNTWWSNDFYSLKSAVYDTVPSPVVTDFRVKFNGSYNLASDSIMVNCTWSGEGVEQGTVDTNRTILWNAKSYRIIRKLNDQQWIQDEIPVQKDLDVYMYQKPTFNRDFKWQISVIDSAGNVTKGEWVISENFLETPEPPIPISYRSCKVPEVECDSFFVEIAMDPSHFSLAYRNSDIKDRLLCQIGWTRDDTCTCTTGWGSIKVDTTWFRVKVKKIMGNDTLVGVESAWSPVVAFSEGSSEAKNLTNIENNNSIQSFKLYSNRPNPFNNSTVIRYELPEKSDVKISIFNMRGSLVKQFSRNKLSSGSYCIEWDGTDMNYKNVSSGIYICFLMVKTEGGKLFKNDIKMLLIK